MNHRTLRDRIWQVDQLRPDEPPTLRRGATYGVLAVAVLSLGLNWPILGLSTGRIGPLWLTALRLVGGLVTWVLIAAATDRLRRPVRGDLPVVVSVGVFRLGLVYPLVFVALQFVPAGRSSVLLWTSSLWAVPMAAAMLGERMTRLRWTGLAVGTAGIVLLTEPWRMAWDELTVVVGHVLLVVAAVSSAYATVHVRRHRWVSTPFELAVWQLLLATVPLVALAWVVEGPLRADWTPSLVSMVLYQGVLATGLALWAQVSVLRSLPAVSTNLSMMLVPVIGLGSSALLIGEALNGAVLSGVACIGIGVAVNLVADHR